MIAAMSLLSLLISDSMIKQDSNQFKEYVYSDRDYTIVNTMTGEKYYFAPIAVEKCMTPGEFHITPVKVTVDSNTITYTVATDSVVLDKNDVEKGLYVVTEGSFSPKVIRKTGGCNPCTNCGKCSW